MHFRIGSNADDLRSQMMPSMSKDKLQMVLVAVGLIAAIWFLNNWADRRGLSQQSTTVLLLNFGVFGIVFWRLIRLLRNAIAIIIFIFWMVLHFAAQWLLLFRVNMRLLPYTGLLILEVSISVIVLLEVLKSFHRADRDLKFRNSERV